MAVAVRRNLFVNRLKVRRRIARDVGDHIGLVVDAALRRSFIEVTLTSGKVYVGVPLARTSSHAPKAETSCCCRPSVATATRTPTNSR